MITGAESPVRTYPSLLPLWKIEHAINICSTCRGHKGLSQTDQCDSSGGVSTLSKQLPGRNYAGGMTGSGTVINSLKVSKGASIAMLGTGAVDPTAVMAVRIVEANPITFQEDFHQPVRNPPH